MKMELRKTFQFEAAHLLPLLPKHHKCRRLHGHSFSVEIVVTGECDPKLGWLMDYADISAAFKPVWEKLDHYYLNEAHTVSSTTQTVTNATGGIIDLGVTYASTGLPLQRVASVSAAGSYSVVQSTGVYTFNASDEVALNFNYSNFSSASGQQLNVTNQQIGVNPTFQLDYYTNLNQPSSKPFGVRLFSCVASDLSIASKLEDFIMPEIDFEVFANNANQVMNIDFPEIS